MDWKGVKVAILPCAALGDVTIYLRLAWIFHRAGAEVRFIVSTLYPAREYFPWLRVEPSDSVDLLKLADENDLVISYINWLLDGPKDQLDRILARENIAFVTAKKLPRHLSLDGRAVTVLGKSFSGASRPLCLKSRAGLNMVQWVDDYARAAYGLICSDSLPRPHGLSAGTAETARRVVIFPTTPQDKKNYSPFGFRLLAQCLQARGWRVDFVGMPHEREVLMRQYSGFEVHAFPDIRALMDFLSGSSAVISNDSGGGHLASLMELQTFTITRKNEQFVWRPGFNDLNLVLAPLVTFKVLGRYVWRPFVPIWRILSALRRPSEHIA